MFHCHNLIHEDQDMMAAFNTTLFSNFGYNETILSNPMAPQFRARPYTASDLSNRAGPFSAGAIQQQVMNYANFQPYSDDQIGSA